jgi:NADPH2:quinone reductase
MLGASNVHRWSAPDENESAMKALVAHQFGPVKGLKVEDIASPRPRENEALIEVAAAAINFPDVLVIAGRYQIKPPLPFVPGKELAGTVLEVGPGVHNLKVGDRVMALVEYGAFCQQAIAPADACFKVPPGIPLTHAAGIGIAYQTAYFALHHRGRLEAGETVMITAANGSVGIAAMQLAKAAGANVIGIVNAESKKELLLENGADYALVLEEHSDPDEFRRGVWKLTGSRGADLLIESAGGKIFEMCLRAVGWEGRAIVVGFTTGNIPAIKANYLLVKNIGVLGVQWSDYRDRNPALVARVQDEIFSMFESGALNFQLMGTYSLENYPAAFDALASRRTRGKIILLINPAVN